MPKGAPRPDASATSSARIGPPLCVADLRRLTAGMSPADAAREVARIARDGGARAARRAGARSARASTAAATARRARAPARRRSSPSSRPSSAPARSRGPSATTSRSATTTREVDGARRRARAATCARASPRAAGRLRAQDEPGDLHQDRARVVHAEPRGLPVGRHQVERRRAPHDVPEGLPARPTSRPIVSAISSPGHRLLGSHVVARRSKRRGHEVVRVRARRAGGRRPRRRRRSARRPRAATARSTARARSRARPRTPRSSTACTSRGRKTVLDACEAAGVRRVVVASTSGTVAVSEDPEHVATEDDAAPIGLIARWPYYRAKLFAERAALERERGGLEVVSREPEAAARPGRRARLVDRRTCASSSRARVPAVPARRPLVRRRARRGGGDAASRWSAARPGERYLVGACNLTVREFFARLARVSGVPRAVAADAAVARARARGARRRSSAPRGRVGVRSAGRPGERRDGAVLLVPRREQGRARARMVRRAIPNDDAATTRSKTCGRRGVVWPR